MSALRVARRSSPRARAARTAYLMLAPFLVVFAVSIVIPLGYAGVISLFKRQLIGGTIFVGLDNYVRALGDSLFHEGVGRVLLFLAVQVPIMLLIALLAALAIDSGRLAGTPVARILLFLPYAIPAVVATLMWGYIFGGQFGLAGQVFGFLGLPAPDFLGPGSCSRASATSSPGRSSATTCSSSTRRSAPFRRRSMRPPRSTARASCARRGRSRFPPSAPLSLSPSSSR